MAELRLPVHVGFILDGNRRWANQQGLSSLEGHQRGAEVLQEIATHAFHRGVKFVSAFVFSKENWQRTDEEVGYLMNLVGKALDNYLDTFHKEGIRIVVLGRRDGLRAKVLKAITRAEETTKDNDNGTLALCFNYSGQDEIVDATRRVFEKNGGNDEITSSTIAEHLYYPDVPPIDMLIRTSGERRLSGFMLWRVAYSELFFTNAHWPAYTTTEFDGMIKEYADRERRFGK